MSDCAVLELERELAAMLQSTRNVVPADTNKVEGVALETIIEKNGEALGVVLIHRDWLHQYFLNKREDWTHENYFAFAEKWLAALGITAP